MINQEEQIRSLPSPCIHLDLDTIRNRYQSVANAFGNKFEIFFAVKANNHPAVIKTIGDLGGNFDVASLSEVNQVVGAGFQANQLAFSNPVKCPNDIVEAYRLGVRLYAFDSESEIVKLSRLAPKATVYLRVAVDNSGSGWPLEGKYGATADGAVQLLQFAASQDLDVAGLTFHVGSQCTILDNWSSALDTVSKIADRTREQGLRLRMLNLGGGLPAAYDENAPELSVVAGLIKQELPQKAAWAERLIIEPGRFLVADAGTVMASVIGRTERGGRSVIHLDVGLFNGLMEAYEAFWYPIECYRDGQRLVGETELTKLYGPTCDSVDRIADNLNLPRLQVGDRLCFRKTGAYTNSYQCYNGYPFPKVLISSRE